MTHERSDEQPMEKTTRSAEQPMERITRSAEQPLSRLSRSGESSERLARMHTAEHLLTAVMRRLHGSPRNLEFHLGDTKTKCDYEVRFPLEAEDARAVEAAVNAEIARDLPVRVTHITRCDAGHLDLWKVPADADTIRVVSIGDSDSTPCSGAHVAKTSEVGRFVLKSFEMRGPTLVRIRFGLEP